MTRRTRRLADERGLTLLETLMALAVLVIIAVPLAGLVYKGNINRKGEQDRMFSQQATSVVLTQFTNDVRAASGLMGPISDAQALKLRQPTATGTYSYVSYRFADGKLQRGTSDSEDRGPTTWSNVIDPSIFTVQAGTFAYYTLGNLVATRAKDVRRIELRELVLKSVNSQELLMPDAISASMREMSNARALRRNGPAPSVVKDKGAVWVRTGAINLTNLPLTFGSFSAEWTDMSPDPSPLDTLDLMLSDQNGKVTTWRAGPGERYFPGDPPRPLPEQVTVQKGVEVSVNFKFRDTAVITGLTLRFYDPADTTRSNPYVVPIL